MANTRARPATRFVFISDGAGRAGGLGPDPTNRFVWRLIAANNRPLGRSVEALTSFEECLASARRVHGGARDAAGLVYFDAWRRHWTWSVTLDGSRAAACVHPYPRRFECVRGLEQFLSAAEVATPDEASMRQLRRRSLPGDEPDAVVNEARE